jgi:hypothetical protein
MSAFSSPTGALSLSLGVRPPRLGLLVPIVKGLSWPLLVECALASQAQIWGGQANLPFPMTPGFEESELFWALADRLDADTYITTSLSVADMEEVEPNWYQRERARFDEQFADYDAEQTADHLTDFLRQPAVQAEVNPDLQGQLSDRLGVVDGRGGFFPFTSMDEPHWPWGMDVSKLGRVPEEIVDLQTDRALGPVRKLLTTTVSGRLPSRLQTALEAKGVAVRPQVIGDRGQWAQGVTGGQGDDNGISPWGPSEAGLAWYRTGRPSRGPATLVVGNNPWDFALFYALRRWTSLAWWLPSWLMRDRGYMRRLGIEIERLARHDARNVVVTTTSTISQRDRVAREIAGFRGPLGAGVADWQDLLPEEPGRYFEYEHMGRPTPVLLLGEETPELSTPLPQTAPEGDDHQMRWMVEARVDGWSPIRASSELAAKSFLAPNYELGMVRATRYGLAYFNPDVMTFSGQALASNTVRPKIRPLSLLVQLQARLEPHGWSCELSDKGIYAAQTIALFGGVEPACQALRDPLLRPLLDAYQRIQKGDQVIPGRFLSQDQRRYLSLRDVRTVVGKKDAGAVLGRLVESEVLIRGLSLKCRRCRQEGWYGLDEFSRSYRCRRCSLDQPIQKGWWLGDDEPAWLYRLAEVVHQFLGADGDLPLLATWDRFGSGGRPLDITNELKFSRGNGSSFETDIVLSSGHELWLGEATSSTDLQPLDRLDQLGELSGLLSAYGVILATSTSGFKSSVRKRFAEVFDGLWPRVEIINEVKRAA